MLRNYIKKQAFIDFGRLKKLIKQQKVAVKQLITSLSNANTRLEINRIVEKSNDSIKQLLVELKVFLKDFKIQKKMGKGYIIRGDNCTELEHFTSAPLLVSIELLSELKDALTIEEAQKSKKKCLKLIIEKTERLETYFLKLNNDLKGNEK